MTTPPPIPTDYATLQEYADASNRWHRRESDAQFLAKLAELGARTAHCPCGYSPFDSCPVCDGGR